MMKDENSATSGSLNDYVRRDGLMSPRDGAVAQNNQTLKLNEMKSSTINNDKNVKYW